MVTQVNAGKKIQEKTRIQDSKIGYRSLPEERRRCTNNRGGERVSPDPV